ncbi:RepB family plasmid replication initiator protein [Gracilibacillus thailandensis]|uniref:RepB family plasmid replication initiator protein n=1 Tax=Gracilibacillus thailandensis TaxID=563735 RepID=A0A6N7R1G6_9BACI|nr:RepB family plasmid replication initiator protein [Gracilibacillus thailandensis]
MKFKFPPELKPYLLQLKQAFTSYRLSNILSLRSSYSTIFLKLFDRIKGVNKY